MIHKNPTPRLLTLTLAITAMLATPIQATPLRIPAAIDRFIAKLFPNASHYFWVINNAQADTPREMIVDLNAFVKVKKDNASMENRYLLLIRDGQIRGAQHIPLNSDVDCGKDEEV